MSKQLLYLRRIWIGDNANQMLTAVCNKQLDSYLILRKKVTDQIAAFDEEMRVTPLVSPACVVKRCEWCESMTLNKYGSIRDEELR